jgi:hypothetical protein
MPTSWRLLAIAALLVLTVCLVDRVLSRWRATRLRRVARSMRLRYSPIDRFNLAVRVAPSLPDPAAADVRVRDLMYRSTEVGYEYLFTAEYRTGTISGAQRRRVVARADEPHGRSIERFDSVHVADHALKLEQQYRSLVASDSRGVELGKPAVV